MSRRILILSNCSAGLYGFRRCLLERFLEEDSVFVSVPDSGRMEELRALGCRVESVHIDRRGTNPLRDGRLLVYYAALLRRVKPDLVITYTVKPNIYGGILCRLLGVRYAVNVTGLGSAFARKGWLRRLVTWLYRGALRDAQTVFFENEDDCRVMLDDGIVCQKQCRVVMGAGVDLRVYAPAAYPREGETLRFLFLGRVMREKGMDELLLAMKRLRAEGVMCTLDVVGRCEEDYANAIAKGSAEGWLRYHGHQSDVRAFIVQSHCLVLPSYHEGMANANLECAAMARPLITSDIPGCREAVEDGVSGFLCAARDEESLYRVMKRFAALSHEMRTAMGQAGHRRMKELFDKEKVVQATVEGLER